MYVMILFVSYLFSLFLQKNVRVERSNLNKQASLEERQVKRNRRRSVDDDDDSDVCGDLSEDASFVCLSVIGNCGCCRVPRGMAVLLCEV